MDNSLVGGPYIRIETNSNSAPKLLGWDQQSICLLESFTVVPEELHDCVLASAGMSTEWRHRQEMPKFFVVNGGTVSCF